MRFLSATILTTFMTMAACQSTEADAPHRPPVPIPTAEGPTGERAEPRRVLVLVGNAEDMPASEVILIDHLRTGLGLAVFVAAPGETSEVPPADLTVISPSVAPDEVGEDLALSNVPALVLQSGLWDRFGLASGRGAIEAEGAVEVLAEAPPGAGDALVGPQDVTVGSFTGRMTYAEGLAQGATPIAGVVGRPDRPVAFRVEAGRPLTSGVAAARHAAFGYDGDFYGELNGYGWDLFGDTVAWLLGRSVRRDRTAMFVWGDAGTENDEPHQPEWMARARLRELGFAVTLIEDAAASSSDPDTFDLVVVSKTFEAEASRTHSRTRRPG